jgi:hypothetical protein
MQTTRNSFLQCGLLVASMALIICTVGDAQTIMATVTDPNGRAPLSIKRGLAVPRTVRPQGGCLFASSLYLIEAYNPASL